MEEGRAGEACLRADMCCLGDDLLAEIDLAVGCRWIEKRGDLSGVPVNGNISCPAHVA